jgi:ribosomal protein L37AE/L43A
MAPRPHPECPSCGSDRVLPIVYGFPSPELLDMAMQSFVNLGECTVDGSESMWSCDSCHHKWGSSANEKDRELSKEVFAYIESVFVPTSPETQRAAMRERCFQEFVDTVVLQAIIDDASTIHLEGTSLAFVVEGKRVLVSPIPFAADVIESFRNEIEQHGSPKESTGIVRVNVYTREHRVELGLTRMEGGDGLEISLLSHGLATEFLAESSSRQRLPVCPYCGRGLRTKNARQCFDCGMDWHDSFNPFCR